MSLRTIAVALAVLAALLILLATCTPEKVFSRAPAAPTDVIVAGREAGTDSGVASAGRDPASGTGHRRAIAPEVAMGACRQVANALRCHKQMQRVRLARGTHLSQPVLEEGCAAPESRRAAWRPLFEAALAGHVPSMSRFTDGTLFAPDMEWDLEAMALYRTHGYDFLQRAANAGDGGSVFRLAQEMVNPGFGEGVVPYDRVRGLAYARLLLRHADADWQSKLTSQLIGSAFRFEATEWAEAEVLSHHLLSVDAEARLDGWNPSRNGPENEYGCAG